MDIPGTGGSGLPPWNDPNFFNEVGLKAAQEYFFQNHATNSRMIAEGRNAKGFMKGGLRRKLSKEMGEDFKMYTGVAIGQSQDTEESKGIRGEMNELLKNIYLKIAPNTPISSPIQEDITILKNPLGGLEVVFAMSCYHAELSKRYASLASDRRKVLKSVLDEELFKWIWRLFYSLMMSNPKHTPTMQETLSSSGIKFVPIEKQRNSSVQKIIDIGVFLLGTSLSNSHLRFPLCYYFAGYVRQIQYRLLPQISRQKLDGMFTTICKRGEGEVAENVLAAIDFLMNTKGNTQQSFDDILQDEEKVISSYVPPTEAEFIQSRQEFVGEKFQESMSKFAPRASREDIMEGEGVTLIPLLFLMRTLPYDVGQKILENIQGPYLGLIRNRLAYGGSDDVSKSLVDRVEDMIEQRRSRGESYTIATAPTAGSVRTASKDLSPSAGGKVHEKKESAAAEPEQAGSDKPAAAAPQASEAAEAPAPEQGAISQLVNERLIVSWKASNGKLSVGSISPMDIMGLVGVDVRFLVPWVLFALKSGQVLRIPPDKVSKPLLEKILKGMVSSVGVRREAGLSSEDRKGLYQELKGQPPNAMLQELIEKFDIGNDDPAGAGALSEGIAQLHAKLGENLASFLNDPAQDSFREMRAGLSETEKQAAQVLTRVASFG
ncbi:MAG: hypothetical protein O7E56_09635 [SAR324 cluster bacterium]|nr:hypothetical protein [SAR324 cluster bacterium]